MSVFQAPEEDDGPHALQTLQLAKLQASPRVIFASSRADDAFLQRLKQPAGAASDQECTVRLEKSSLFHPESAWRTLQLLHLDSLPKNLTGQAKFHALNTFINLQLTQQVCAAGWAPNCLASRASCSK